MLIIVFILYSLIILISTGDPPIGFYFPLLNYKYNYTKPIQSNFSDLLRYELYGVNTY